MDGSFKKNLKDILQYEDLTVKELAYKTGISKRSIENYLNARESMPPADYACKIAKALNTTVEKLLGESESGNFTPSEGIEDAKILSLIRHLSTDEKKAILQILNSMTKS